MQVEMGWFCAFWIKIIRLLDHYTRQHLSRYYLIWQELQLDYLFKKKINIPFKNFYNFQWTNPILFLPYQCKSAINTRTQTQRWLKFTHGAKFSISQLLIKIVWIRDRVEGGIKKISTTSWAKFQGAKIWFFFWFYFAFQISVFEISHIWWCHPAADIISFGPRIYLLCCLSFFFQLFYVCI